MVTVISQKVQHLGRHLGFFKKNIFIKATAKLVENMCIQPQLGM